MTRWLFVMAIFICSELEAQQDPEFPKGSVFYLGVKQGKNTAFNNTPDLWVGGIYFSPQFTIVPKHLRLGLETELMYTAKHTSALFGPRLAWKIKTIRIPNMGSLLNLQLQAEYLLGTGDQECLYGGNFTIEAFQLLAVDLSAHRDDSNDRWWFRAGLGVRLFHKKKRSEERDPLGRPR